MAISSSAIDDDPCNEQGLLSQARAGDVEAFGDVCRLFEGRLLRQAVTLGCDVATAEDLVQETLVQAWKSLRRYDGSCRFYTWLCAILLNRRRHLLRRRHWLWFIGPQRQNLDQMETLADTQALPNEAAEARDGAKVLRQCIAALPPRHQQVIYLRFYADDSLEGIAAAVGCSIGTVKSRLFHALEKLRRMKALRPSERKSADALINMPRVNPVVRL